MYLLFHQTVYNLFNTVWSHCKVCNRCASRESNLLVSKIPQLNHQSSRIVLINVSSRLARQGQILVGNQKHGQFFSRFPLDYTCCVDHLYFSWIDGNITLAKQLYSVFYEGQKMIGYLFREELLQIVILFPIGNHIFRHVATLVSACKLRQS